MMVTYNFVTKSEQGYLTTSKMWRMLISGVIYIKQADAQPRFLFENEILAWFRIFSSKFSKRSQLSKAVKHL